LEEAAASGFGLDDVLGEDEDEAEEERVETMLSSRQGCAMDERRMVVWARGSKQVLVWRFGAVGR
jgi:hypothetical protein